MESKNLFSYVWRATALAILSSPLIAIYPAEGLPNGVPNQPCGTLSNPNPGTLCYTVTPGGGKASAGGHTQRFSTIIQSTEPEYVIASVVVEVTSAAGERQGPTVNQISRGGTASVVSVAIDKQRELRQIRGELQAKATVLSGPALMEAQAKLSALSQQEHSFEEVVTQTIAAGQDAGKFEVSGSASPRKCGTLNLDKCGSWIEYKIYVVRRYVGNPIAAYNRAFAVAQDARNTINRLIASQSATIPQQTSTPNPPLSGTTFQNPTEMNTPIDVALKGANGLDANARQVGADTYCRFKGYKRAVNFQTANGSSKGTLQFETSTNRWIVCPTCGMYFTRIVCQ